MFQKWVSKYGGQAKLARKLGVHRTTVYYWTRGIGAPRSGTLFKLVKLSRGKLTAHQILLDSTKNVRS